MKIHRFMFVLLLVLTLLLCTACGTSEDDNTLRVLTVRTHWDQMNDQVKNAKMNFLSQYPNRDVKIEYLPEDADQREIRMEQLRVEIMAGKGPDVFIFPTEMSTSGASIYRSTSTGSKTLLFPDVNQAIQNGHFLDISEQYDADTELGKEGLNTKVMDAGLYEGMRVLLPLRYNLPVYMVDSDRLAETGKDLEWLANTDIVSKMDEAIMSQNPNIAACTYPYLILRNHLLTFFYDRFDYISGNIDLTVEELAEFLERTKMIKALCTEAEYPYHWGLEIHNYLTIGRTLGNGKCPVQQGMLQEAVDGAVVCKAENVNYTMAPCRMVDGSVVAVVTWYGAVGSGCDQPDVAYDFLRLFLTEEYQWERNRPGKSPDYANTVEKISLGMVGEGFPVRDRGAAGYVDLTGGREVSRYTSNGVYIVYPITGQYTSVNLTDEDLPFLDFEIDAVRFPLAMERSFWENICVASDEQGNPIYESTTEMAEEILKQLRYQLAEG